MEITNAQYTKIKSFITPTGTTVQQRNKRLGFDSSLKTRLNFTRWEDTLEKRGYAGITLSSPTSTAPANLEIIWTDDGITGYPLPLDDITLGSLRDWLNTYNG